MKTKITKGQISFDYKTLNKYEYLGIHPKDKNYHIFYNWTTGNIDKFHETALIIFKSELEAMKIYVNNLKKEIGLIEEKIKEIENMS